MIIEPSITTKPTIDAEGEFRKLSTVYPKKVKYFVGLGIYATMRMQGKLPPVEELVEAVEKQRKSYQWQDSRFIPNLDKWLTEYRWMDELPAPTEEEETQSEFANELESMEQWALENGWKLSDIPFKDFQDAYWGRND